MKTAKKPVKKEPDSSLTASGNDDQKNNDNIQAADCVKDIIEGTITEKAGAPEDIDPEFLNDFLVESREHIENIEMNVLALETDPTNTEMINSLFRSFHTIKGLAGFVNQDLIREIAHQTETQLDKCRKGETAVSKDFVDLILASSDLLKKICDNLNLNSESDFLLVVESHLARLNSGITVNIEHKEQALENHNNEYQALKVDKIGEILVNQGLDPKIVEDLLVKQDDYPGLKLGQVAVKEKKAEAQTVIKSLRIQEKATHTLTNDGAFAGYTRVSTVKIDNLVNLIGELVITQSQIEQDMVKRFGTNDAVVNKLLRMEKISREIQNISMSLQMTSLKSTFQKINRIGRDTIAELSKNVNLEINGEETEIDRGVAERILDPLVHLVKNAISHGIEIESDRISKGKPAQGTVKIHAYSKRGNVYIEIEDDGQGMNSERIYQKAVEKKLLDPLEPHTEEEILGLIFLPGFSTAENINNISGRGVGLDVVKTEISKLGGKVDFKNQVGKGCIFTLKIPINLAVINGTIVDIMGVCYILPTINIKQIINPEVDQWISIAGNKAMIRIKNEVIPLLSMAKVFGLPAESEAETQGELIVIIEMEQAVKAIAVRNIVDRREIVVKPLGSEFSHLDYVAGASILGDGSVSLILDLESIFKLGEAI